jgi:hypothetical protein
MEAAARLAGRLRVAQRGACRTCNPAAARGGDYLIVYRSPLWGTFSSSLEITPRRENLQMSHKTHYVKRVLKSKKTRHLRKPVNGNITVTCDSVTNVTVTTVTM